MTFKGIVKACSVLCITAILGIAVCGCEDLGAYNDVDEYYDSFGNIVLIDGATGDREEYSVEDYFYNKESKENFLAGEDGVYRGVPHNDYVYMAIPVESSIDADTLALYIQAKADVVLYIYVYLTDEIPDNIELISENENPDGESDTVADEQTDDQSEQTDDQSEQTGDQSEQTDDQSEQTGDQSEQTGDQSEQTGDQSEQTGDQSEQTGDQSEQTSDEPEQTEKEYDDPDLQSKIGEIVIHLEGEKWDSFVLDEFIVNGETQKSIQINEGQYLLIQILNNSGMRIWDKEKQIYVHPQTGVELQQADITMTNLLIRALERNNGNGTQEGE
jgi:hypothetical protein